MARRWRNQSGATYFASASTERNRGRCPVPRSPAWLAISVFALLTLAACAQQQATAPPAATPAPLTSDQQFVDRAALGTASEAELGQLARTRAASPAVRAFANP